MQLIILSCFLIAGAVAAQVVQEGRRYFPHENEGIKQRYIVIPDDKGHLRIEDLQLEVGEPRANITDVTFYLYTVDNPLPEQGEQISADNFDALVASPYFNPARKTVFLIHGWTGDYMSSMATAATATLLAKHDLNVFSVDWSGPASEFYTASVREVPSVGGFVGDFVLQMIDHFGISPADMMIAGHSLGAHVVGRVGAMLGGQVDHIVGLDPASPLFTLEDIESRLDTTDAQYLQVIHSNGGLLGFQSSIGHSDYFPNGGEEQPGCGVDVTGFCSHTRCHQYFAESIATSGFRAVKCTSYEDFSAGLCAGNEETYMGEYPVDKTASGDYYLDTSDTAPFALG